MFARSPGLRALCGYRYLIAIRVTEEQRSFVLCVINFFCLLIWLPPSTTRFPYTARVRSNGPDWYDSRAIMPESGAGSTAAPLERRRADNRAFSASFGPLVPHQTKPSDFGCIPACVGAGFRSVLVGMGRTGVIQAANRAEQRSVYFAARQQAGSVNNQERQLASVCL